MDKGPHSRALLVLWIVGVGAAAGAVFISDATLFVQIFLLSGISFYAVLYGELLIHRIRIARRVFSLPPGEAGEALSHDTVEALMRGIRFRRRTARSDCCRWLGWFALAVSAGLFFMISPLFVLLYALFSPAELDTLSGPFVVTQWRALTILLNIFIFFGSYLASQVGIFRFTEIHFLHLWARRAQIAPRHLQRAAERGVPFALYLRSFSAEEPVVIPFMTDIGGWYVLDHREIDTRLVAFVRDWMPVYALGNVQDPRPAVGVLPVYVEPRDWPVVATELIRRASVILVFVESWTTGVCAEVEEIVAQNRSNHTLLILSSKEEAPSRMRLLLESFEHCFTEEQFERILRCSSGDQRQCILEGLVQGSWDEPSVFRGRNVETS